VVPPCSGPQATAGATGVTALLAIPRVFSLADADRAPTLVFGIASAVDMALFYPSGKVMDRHGRLAATGARRCRTGSSPRCG